LYGAFSGTQAGEEDELTLSTGTTPRKRWHQVDPPTTSLMTTAGKRKVTKESEKKLGRKIVKSSEKTHRMSRKSKQAYLQKQLRMRIYIPEPQIAFGGKNRAMVNAKFSISQAEGEAKGRLGEPMEKGGVFLRENLGGKKDEGAGRSIPEEGRGTEKDEITTSTKRKTLMGERRAVLFFEEKTHSNKNNGRGSIRLQRGGGTENSESKTAARFARFITRKYQKMRGKKGTEEARELIR